MYRWSLASYWLLRFKNNLNLSLALFFDLMSLMRSVLVVKTWRVLSADSNIRFQ